MVEVDAKYTEQGQNTHGYLLRNDVGGGGGIETGWFFNEGTNCFYYGDMISGDNGVNLFIPYDTERAMGLGVMPVCAGYNEGFAKIKQ